MKFPAACHRLLIGGALLAGLLIAGAAATADPASVQVQRDAGIERIRLTLPHQVGAKTAIDGRTLTMTFDRPLDLDIQAFKGLTQLAAEPRIRADGLGLELDLKPGVTALSYTDERVQFIDLLQAERGQGAAPSAPAPKPEKAAADRIAVRTGEHREFTRIVFDWPAAVDYRIERAGDLVTLRFEKQADLDAKRMTQRRLALVSGVQIGSDAAGASVRLNVVAGTVIRDFRLGPKVVIDVLRPGSRDVSVAVAHRLTSPPDAGQPPPPVEAVKPPAAASPLPAPPPAPIMSADAHPVRVASEDGSATPALATPIPTAPAAPVLRFEWPQPVAAAVFQRGETIWCVFGAPSEPDVAALTAAAANAVANLAVLPHADATILRMTTAGAATPRLARDGHAWLLSFGGEDQTIESIVPQPELGVDTGPQLVLPVRQPSSPIGVTDPESGENLVVVPVVAPGRGLRRGYRYPTFRLLASVQGVVIQPLIDTLEVRSSPDGVLLSSVQGLGISPMSTAQRIGAHLAPPPDVTRILAFRGWVDPPASAFVARRQALLQAISTTTGEAQRRAQFELAHLHLAHGLAAEALADTLTLERNGMIAGDRATAQMLIGVSSLLLGRVDDARKALADARLAGIDEARLWAAAAAAAGEPLNARHDFGRWSALVLAYPRALRGVAQPLLIEAALSQGQHEAAALLLTAARGDAATADESAWLDYLDGRVKQARGETDNARAAFGRAAEAASRRANAYAGMALVDLDLAAGKLTQSEAVERLESLAYAWRGDDFEIDLLLRLGEMYAQRHDYPRAMRAFRKVAGSFHGSPKADTAAQRLGQLFETVFLQGDLDASSPMAEVALYNEFKELTPAGDKGRQIILGLSRRLMALDLSEQVIALIEPTLRTAPADNRRAELGLVLAEAYARAGNWEAVIDTLKRTAGGDEGPPSSDSRNLLAAKALMQLGRRDEALARLATLGSADAMRIRAALLRRDGDWKAVAEAIDRLLASQGQAAPAAVRGAVIDLSVARTLAGDTAAIGEIARAQAPVMAGTADEAAFRLLTGSGIGTVPDRESLKRSVDEAVQFRDALKAPLGGGKAGSNAP